MWIIAEGPTRSEGEPAELHQDAAALLILLPPLLQAGHHRRQRREPRRGAPRRPYREFTLRGKPVPLLHYQPVFVST